MIEFNKQVVLDWAKAQIAARNAMVNDVFDMNEAKLVVDDRYADRDDIVVADIVLPLEYGEYGLTSDIFTDVVVPVMEWASTNEDRGNNVDGRTWLVGDGDDGMAARLMDDGLHIWVRWWADEEQERAQNQ